jgi:hypothetical protein
MVSFTHLWKKTIKNTAINTSGQINQSATAAHQTNPKLLK